MRDAVVFVSVVAPQAHVALRGENGDGSQKHNWLATGSNARERPVLLVGLALSRRLLIVIHGTTHTLKLVDSLGKLGESCNYRRELLFHSRQRQKPVNFVVARNHAAMQVSLLSLSGGGSSFRSTR